MALQLGRALLIKRGASATAGPFSSVAGVRSRTFRMSNNLVDTTRADPDNPTNIPIKTGISGIQDNSFDAAGLFDSTAAGIAVADDARLGRVWQYQVIVPGYGTFQGPYVITDFQFTGDTETPMEFSCKFNPSDAVIFTAE